MSDLTEFELYAVGRIKGLQKELAELKASIPKIKHDAIMEVTERYGICLLYTSDAADE